MLDQRKLVLAFLVGLIPAVVHSQQPKTAAPPSYDWLLPNDQLKQPSTPIVLVSRGQDRKAWEALPQFWNETTEKVPDPKTGSMVDRKVVKIRMPLGLNVLPPIPVENPMTVERWALGKKLYFDPILSSDGTVSCSSCHSPREGFSDGSKVSTGIAKQKGGMNAPTVFNSAFSRRQFWDGRAASLEEQAQGPVQNPIEMFDGKGNPWNEAIKRIRGKADYNKAFEAEFGHAPTRDAAAKAIACYERTVLIGNAIQDRAEVAARKRAQEDGGPNTVQSVDYETVIKTAFAAKDLHAISALGLDATKDEAKIPAVAKSIDRGRVLFFGKARCNNCHVGESFTDLDFHNLGVGAVKGKLSEEAEGRFGSQSTGHKDPTLFGAFKTPPLRGLLASKPYMHDGSEASLEAVVEFYEKGGNANEYLDQKMRDLDAEAAYEKAKQSKQPWKGPEVTIFTPAGRPIIPFKLGLTPEEKKDLVMFMRALESDPVDPLVTNDKK